MLLGNINYPGTYEAFLKNAVWEKALPWLAQEAAAKPVGEYELDGRNMYVTVANAALETRQQRLFEAHRQYIDIHFALEEGELIEWAPVNTLTPTMEFDTEKDYCLYTAPAQASSLIMTPGSFAIFFPEDAHMPKITAGDSREIKKVVVKIQICHTKH